MVGFATLLVATSLTATPRSCRDAYEALRFQDAVNLCEEQIPTQSGDDLRASYLTLGLSLAAVGQSDQALLAYASLLSLDPTAAIDPSLSPRLRAPFLEAVAAGAGAPVVLRLTATPPYRVGRPLRLRIDLHDSPLGPVRSLQIGWGAQTRSLERAGDTLEVDLSPPQAAGAQRVVATARDSFGGELSRQELDLQVAPATRPFLTRWKVWALAAITAGGVGAVGGIANLDLTSEATNTADASEATLAAHRASGAAIVADVALPLAAALAITSGIFLLVAGD